MYKIYAKAAGRTAREFRSLADVGFSVGGIASTAILLTMVTPGSVLAEEVASAAGPQSGQQYASLAQSDSSDASGLETITVTSTRRSQDIQIVPATVTAINGQTIEQQHLDNAIDIAEFAPNTIAFNFDGRNRPRFYIRGIGNGNVADNAVGAVAVYTDEVYLNNLAFQGFPVFDLARVEVLNGPQGTLWGKNATAGAVQFVSQRPTFEQDGYAQVDFGDYGQKRGEVVLNGPIDDEKLAARLSLRYEDQDGWATNTYNGKQSGNFGDLAGRFQLLDRVNDDLDILLNVHGQDQQGTRVPFYTAAATTSSSPLILGNRDYTNSNVSNRQSLTSYGASVNVNWRLNDDLTLNSISAFESGERRAISDTDSTPLEYGRGYADTRPTQFSQEVRLSSATDQRVYWTTGAYYFHEYLSDYSAAAILPPGAVTTPAASGAPGYTLTTFNQTTDSAAVFGNATVNIIDDLKISGGLRWTYDELTANLLSRQATGSVSYFNLGNWWLPGSVNAPLATINTLDQTKSWSKLNYEVEPQYQLSPDQYLYVRIASGYRAGNFNTQITPNSTNKGAAPLQGAGVVNPETITSYEAGYKSSWLNNRLVFDIDGFYSDYNNIQISYTATDPKTKATIIALANAASGRAYGGELAVQALPLSALSISANLGILNTAFTDFTGPTTTVNLTGNQFARAPHVTASVGADYRFDLPWGEASVGTRWNYTGHYYYLVSNETAPALQQAAYFVGDLHGSFKPSDSRWEFSGIVNNISDAIYKTQVLPYSATSQTFSYSYGPPLTFLLSAKLNFF